MSFVEGMSPLSFDLADPTFVLYACGALIVVFLVLDAPAIGAALRFVRLRWKLANRHAHPRREQSNIVELPK